MQIAGVQFAYEFQYISTFQSAAHIRSCEHLHNLMAKELGAIAHGESRNTWRLYGRD